MLNSISGMTPYSAYSVYGADKAQAAQRSSVVMTARKAAQPETPVQPVTPTRPVDSQEDPAQAGLVRYNSDSAEMAVRMRIQYPDDSAQQSQAAQQDQSAQQAQNPALSSAADDGQKLENPILEDSKGADSQKVENPVLKDSQAAEQQKLENPALKDTQGADDQKLENPAVEESKSAQEVMEEGECETCKERKYQDGSDDPGVSFKTPTHIAPEQAASAVRGHEGEHVVREQAKARQEDRKVVSQSVTYHTDICPECGKVYVSGGTTRTVTKANNSEQAEQQNQQQANQQDPRRPFAAIA